MAELGKYTLYERMADNDQLLISKIYFRFWNFVGSWKFWLLRAWCWWDGCDDHRGVGWNMPEDCTEWWCDRCGANGINAQVWTRELLDSRWEMIVNWFSMIPYRIRQRVCRHRDIGWRLFDERFGMAIEKPVMWGWCRKCHKRFSENLEWFPVEVDDVEDK